MATGTLAVSGNIPLTYTVTGRPSWMAFDDTTGILSGTPTATGTHDLTYTVEDDGRRHC